MTNKTKTNKIGVALHAPITVEALLRFAQHVHDQMAANAKLLPSPTPALTVLQTDIDTLDAKETIVKTRVVGAVIDRDAALKVLKVDLHNERKYVELVANSDPENAASIASAAGMSLFKAPLREKPPLAVKAGATSGIVHVVAKATKGARANNWQMSTDGGKTWVDLPETTKATTQVANLTPGTSVQFRQRALTKNGATDWSLPVPHVVQ